MANVAIVPRFYVFVGCDIEDCDFEHVHFNGWDAIASASNDLNMIREVCMDIPDHLWWHVVDIVEQRVIMRSTDGDGSTHH